MEANPQLCPALRGDGAQCEDEIGHLGSHVWPELAVPIVRVGDTIWFYVELVRQMLHDQPNPIRLRVTEIRTEADGAKMLVLDRAERPAHGR
jgi:hypothetical protein